MGIRSERVEAVGAAGRTTWIAVVGLADETSARKGSAVYPSFARLGASRPPQHVQVETTCRRVGEPHRSAVWLKDGVSILERVNFGKKITGGVKIIRAQDYAGVDTPGLTWIRQSQMTASACSTNIVMASKEYSTVFGVAMKR